MPVLMKLVAYSKNSENEMWTLKDVWGLESMLGQAAPIRPGPAGSRRSRVMARTIAVIKEKTEREKGGS